MPSTQSLHENLSALFSASDIGWRVGPTTAGKDMGQALPRLLPRAVQDRLDKTVGPENWGATYRVVEADIGGRKVASVFCGLALYAQDRWVTKEGSAELSMGAESGDAPIDPFQAAVSESFTRAAVLWGVGRYLDRIQPPWVALNDGRNFAAEPSLPDHLLPEVEGGHASTGQATGVPPVAATAASEPPAKAPASAAKLAAVPAAAPVKAPVPPAATPAAPASKGSAGPVAAPEPGIGSTPAAPVEAAGPAAGPAAPAGAPDPTLVAAMAKLEGKALEMAKNVLERAKAGTAPIGMLRNYLNGDSAKKLLADDIRAALAAELDTIEIALKAAA